MKKIGMIGGLGPESTVDYYKIINKKVREKTGHNPNILIDSIDIYEMLVHLNNKKYEEIENILLKSINTLKSAGVDFIFIASNTPHIVFDQLVKKTDIKLISIVESTLKKIAQDGFERVLLTGTRVTMKENFYGRAASKYNIELVLPDEEEINQIHSVIFPELEEGIIVPEKKEMFINIVENIKKRENIDAVILACTELPIMIKPHDLSIKTINTVDCHIEEIMNEIFS